MIWYGWINKFAVLSLKIDGGISDNGYLNVDIYFFGTWGKVRHIFTYASWSGTWSTRSRNTSSWGPIGWSSGKRTSRTTRSSSSSWWVIGSVCGRKVNHRSTSRGHFYLISSKAKNEQQLLYFNICFKLNEKPYRVLSMLIATHWFNSGIRNLFWALAYRNLM